MTLNVLNDFPENKLSLIKSIAQHSLAFAGNARGSGSREGKRFLPFRRKLSFKPQ
ncbi:hypothetical protein ORI98_02285 [Shewanella sp. ULN5]|nr:hypothetical protein [Shewanella sp. ULN5]MDP5145268.1 hypothetical protein [Shewanella sp. ULN5]